MRIFKLIMSSLIIAIIALFIYQNLATFNNLIGFRLDLYFREPLEWQHFLYTIIVSSALLGFMVGILLMFKPYLKTRRLLAQERQIKQAVPPPKEATDPTPPIETDEAASSAPVGNEQ